MDKEQIRKALDHFEKDEFTDAKEILQQEISTAAAAHLGNKLGLQEFGHDKDDDDKDDDKKKKKKNDDDDEDLDEGSTEDAAGALKAIIGSLKKGDKDNDMLKMANGIMDYYKKEKSFAPKHAQWIFNTSKSLFK